MGFGKLLLHAKFEVGGVIYYGNIREYVLNDKFAFSTTLWGVRGNVRTSSIARYKRVVDFLFGIIERFLLALTADALIRRKRLCGRGWVTLGLNIMLKGYIYRQHIYSVR